MRRRLFVNSRRSSLLPGGETTPNNRFDVRRVFILHNGATLARRPIEPLNPYPGTVAYRLAPALSCSTSLGTFWVSFSSFLFSMLTRRYSNSVSPFTLAIPLHALQIHSALPISGESPGPRLVVGTYCIEQAVWLRVLTSETGTVRACRGSWGFASWTGERTMLQTC